MGICGVPSQKPMQRPGADGWGKLCLCGCQRTCVEKELTAFSVKTPWDVRPPHLFPQEISHLHFFEGRSRTLATSHSLAPLATTAGSCAPSLLLWE